MSDQTGPTILPTISPSDGSSSCNTIIQDNLIAIVLFFLFGISLGTFTGYLIRVFSFPVPYAVVVFFEGVAIAFIFQSYYKTVVDDVTTVTLSSDLILYCFLPALLFGEIKSLNWHHLKSGFNQASLLAGPGALIACLLTASLFELIYSGYGDWEPKYIYYTLGAILCATDPVSIVTLLKSTGASSKLTIVIVGESLLNDATAMILYFLFEEIVIVTGGQFLSPSAFFTYFALKIIASPILGASFGFVAVFLMKKLYEDWNINDISIQIVITLVCAYSSFYYAEMTGSSYLNGSGVLSVCAAGAVFSWICSPRILTDESMVHTWENLEWICNTLIFMLGGVMTGGTLGIEAINYAYLLALYVLVQLIRVFMVTLMYPLVSSIGLKISREGALFTSFAGVRGALAIALALSFKANLAKAGFKKQGSEFYFFVSGLAAMTLLINGTLAEPLLHFLKIVEDPNQPKSAEMVKVLRNVKRAIRRQVKEDIEVEGIDPEDYDAKEVQRQCRLMRSSFDSADGAGDEYEPTERDENGELKSDLLAYVRTTFLETVRAHYWQSVQSGKIGTQAFTAQLLVYSVDKGIDSIYDADGVSPSTWTDLGDLASLERNLLPNATLLRVATFFDDFFAMCGLFPGYVAYMESLKERRAMYTLSNFIDAHLFAQGQLHKFLGAPEKEVGGWIPEETVVMMGSKRSVERAKQLLKLIESQHLREFNNQRTARVVLIRQKEIVTQMKHDGALPVKWADAMLATIEDDEARNDIERASMSRSFLRDNTKRKIGEDKELRQSLSDRGSMSDSLVRNTFDGRASLSIKPTLRQSLAERQSFQAGVDPRASASFAANSEYNDTFADAVSARPSFSSSRPSISGRQGVQVVQGVPGAAATEESKEHL